MSRLVAVFMVLLVVAPSAAAGTDVAAEGTPRSEVVWLDPGVSTTPITSPNVNYHGTIPLDSPAVGGEVVNHINGKRYFYVTGGKGLTIYDVANPELPTIASVFPFPHLQNEDLKVSEDGTRAMIAADGALLVAFMPAQTRGIHIIDTTDPTAPVVLGRHPDPNHTAECADPRCEWIYGSNGFIYDARDPAAIIKLGRWDTKSDGDAVSSRHALRRDETGILISDSHPRLILDPRNDPASPILVAEGARVQAADSRLQHNNVRPDADEWVPRDAADDTDAIEMVTVPDRERTVEATLERPIMRPGEMFIGNAESNINNRCSAAGGLSTWSMIDFDKGASLQQLEVFRPLNGTWADGSPGANALGCSGHWFTENDGYVAASWYEHGVRFFQVDKTIGTIEEVGYFQPVATEAGAAYWIDDTYVYNVDYARGIDIVSFNREAPLPSKRQLVRSWLVNLEKIGSLAAAERYFCRLGAQN